MQNDPIFGLDQPPAGTPGSRIDPLQNPLDWQAQLISILDRYAPLKTSTVFRTFYGTFSTTFAHIEIDLVPQYWIVYLAADDCVLPVRIEQQMGDYVGVYLPGPGSISGATISLDSVEVSNLTTTPISGHVINAADIALLNVTGSPTAKIAANAVDLTASALTLSSLDLSGDASGNIDGGGGCLGDERRRILPGIARELTLTPPSGNTANVYYMVAAVAGFNPKSIF